MPWLLNQVDEGEDHDPDDVDEVPVQRAEVHEQRILRAESAFAVDEEQRHQPQHADADVSAGVLWLMTLFFIDRKRGLGPKDALLVDLCALYWHFVDVVWIVIFTLVYLIE